MAALVEAHPEVERARVIARREGEMDAMTVQIETEATEAADYETTVASTLKLKGQIELIRPGGLPRDGLVIEDQRCYD